jgi:hypothetical protein
MTEVYTPTAAKAQSIYRRLQELLPEVKAWRKLEVKVLDQQRDGSAGDAVEWSCGLHAVANIMHMVCTSGQPESRQGRNSHMKNKGLLVTGLRQWH